MDYDDLLARLRGPNPNYADASAAGGEMTTTTAITVCTLAIRLALSLVVIALLGVVKALWSIADAL